MYMFCVFCVYIVGCVCNDCLDNILVNKIVIILYGSVKLKVKKLFE